MTPAEIVAKLAADCPWLGDPVRAFDQCIAASVTLQRDMMTMGGYAASVCSPKGFVGEAHISAQGALPDLWRDVFRREDWCHSVLLVPDYDGVGQARVIDMTARQFDPEAPFPWVATVEEFAVRWPAIRESLQRVAAKAA